MSKTHTTTKYSKACHKGWKALKLRNSVARFSDLPRKKWSFLKTMRLYHGGYHE